MKEGEIKTHYGVDYIWLKCLCGSLVLVKKERKQVRPLCEDCCPTEFGRGGEMQHGTGGGRFVDRRKGEA